MTRPVRLGPKVRINEWEFVARSMVTFMHSRSIGSREETELYSGTLNRQSASRGRYGKGDIRGWVFLGG